MTTYTRILVPHDGSKHSDSALKNAAKIAKASSANILLFNVIEEIVIPAMIERPKVRSSKTGEVISMEKYLKELYQDMKKSVAKSLHEKNVEYQKLGVTIEVKVVVGHPSDKIVEYAKEEKVDLIVMGTAGLGSVFKLAVFGSVARKVSEYISCPVILIR
ncbi:MAG TPA: universal stress protein [Nitrososphaeraceae archaeon]|jgi:nucleotide-binding universal stress UspA family protein